MKRRVRTQPTNPYYSNEPAVSRSKMADSAPTQNASLGNATPKFVDKKPGRLSGLAGFQDKHKLPAKGANTTPVKFPTADKSPPKQGGNLKLSGHPGAHQLGKFPKLKV